MRAIKTLTIICAALGAGIAIRQVANERFDVADGAFILGGFAFLCLAGIGYGVWAARKAEQRRKSQIDIWLNH